ncbi:unnamed protein product [Rhizopus microsporus]
MTKDKLKGYEIAATHSELYIRYFKDSECVERRTSDDEIAQQKSTYPLKVCGHCSAGNRMSVRPISVLYMYE